MAAIAQRREQVRVRVSTWRLEGRKSGDDEEHRAGDERRERRLRDVEQRRGKAVGRDG